MSGGTVRGWLPDVAVVLWRRLLGLLGDPNDVASPQIHAQIFKYLSDLTETLVKVQQLYLFLSLSLVNIMRIKKDH